MLKKQCKSPFPGLSLPPIVVFIVQYEQDIVHAIDGLGTGVIFVPANGNFLVKVYDSKHTPKGSNQPEGFTNIVKPLLELAALYLKN